MQETYQPLNRLPRCRKPVSLVYCIDERVGGGDNDPPRVVRELAPCQLGRKSKANVPGRTEWVRVMLVPGMAEAEMWRTLLAEEDVVAFIQPNDASAYLGPSSFCHVLVPAEDAERAAELIAAWSTEPAVNGTDQPRD